MSLPIFVTRAHVGRGRGVVLVSIDSPAGELAKGEVPASEAMRIVMTEATFAEITAVFVETLKRIQLAKVAGSNGHSVHDEAPADRGLSMETFTGLHASTHKH
jgi:hypothetical protein